MTYTRTIILGVKAKLQNRSSSAVLLHAGLMMSSRIISAAGAEALRASMTFGFLIVNPSRWRSFSLWSENERGYGSRWPRDREVDPARTLGLLRDLRSVLVGVNSYRVSRVHVRLSLRQSVDLATQRPKGRVCRAGRVPACLKLITGRKSACRKSRALRTFRLFLVSRFPVTATCDAHSASPDRRSTLLQGRSFGIQRDRQ